MTDDIVARLRSSLSQRKWWPRDRLEAADEIERLRERGDDWRAAMTENHDLWNENERLRAALRLLIAWHNDTGVVMWDVLIDVARAALEGGEEK
jgi:hypothetical protein